MTDTVPIDTADLFRAAHDTARQQEAQAHASLWDHITQRASVDADFRRLLQEDPQRATEQEARALQNTPGQPAAAPAVIEAVAQQARATFSTVVPEVASQRVEDLIFGTIEDLRRSFKLTLWLSQVLFYSGLGITLAAFVSTFFRDQKWISLLFGAGGLVSMILSSMVTSPLDRVQNAAGHLIQLQMAYLAYYKQLYLLKGTTGASARDDAIAYAQAIEHTAVTMMSSVRQLVKADAAAPTAPAPAPQKGGSGTTTGAAGS